MHYVSEVLQSLVYGSILLLAQSWQCDIDSPEVCRVPLGCHVSLKSVVWVGGPYDLNPSHRLLLFSVTARKDIHNSFLDASEELHVDFQGYGRRTAVYFIRSGVQRNDFAGG